jgi:hypothetical protein
VVGGNKNKAQARATEHRDAHKPNQKMLAVESDGELFAADTQTTVVGSSGTGASEAIMSIAKYAERAPVHPTRRSGAGRSRNRQEETMRLLHVTAGAVINRLLNTGAGWAGNIQY